MVVMPADHLIQPAEAFQAAIRQAAAIVEEQPETLVTFGIKPTYPAESFGYIETGQASQGSEVRQLRRRRFEVARFREKPARSVAEEYLASGNFYWNSGIFVWKARTILDAIATLRAGDLRASARRFSSHVGKPEFAAVLDREFTAIRGKSIDFAVMEHYQPVVVIEAPFTWDDVGSWQALARSVGHRCERATRSIGKHLGIRTERLDRPHERRSSGRDARPEGLRSSSTRPTRRSWPTSTRRRRFARWSRRWRSAAGGSICRGRSQD